MQAHLHCELIENLDELVFIEVCAIVMVYAVKQLPKLGLVDALAHLLR